MARHQKSYIGKILKTISHMSERELRGELRTMRAMMRVARCPDPGCLNGSINHQVGHNEWEQERCQWCAQRLELIGL